MNRFCIGQDFQLTAKYTETSWVLFSRCHYITLLEIPRSPRFGSEALQPETSPTQERNSPKTPLPHPERPRLCTHAAWCSVALNLKLLWQHCPLSLSTRGCNQQSAMCTGYTAFPLFLRSDHHWVHDLISLWGFYHTLLSWTGYVIVLSASTIKPMV